MLSWAVGDSVTMRHVSLDVVGLWPLTHTYTHTQAHTKLSHMHTYISLAFCMRAEVSRTLSPSIRLLHLQILSDIVPLPLLR
eukprot:m.431393 g.431393  ORF g.431393 m.431393 type:complete len:82 (-) comp84266_c0_seq1:185-430(-)